MEIRLGDHLNSDLFLYERSRFRSAVAGVIITCILTTGCGVVVWPVLSDLLDSQVNTLRVIAMVLGLALIGMVIIWLYFVVRLIVRFYVYKDSLREGHKSLLPSSITLVVILLLVGLVPVVVRFFNPIV
ncbi:hypothetical protein D9M68_881400 [compost metagenome]